MAFFSLQALGFGIWVFVFEGFYLEGSRVFPKCLKGFGSVGFLLHASRLAKTVRSPRTAVFTMHRYIHDIS